MFGRYRHHLFRVVAGLTTMAVVIVIASMPAYATAPSGNVVDMTQVARTADPSVVSYQIDESCTGPIGAVLYVSATSGNTVASTSQGLQCPMTNAHLSGTLTAPAGIQWGSLVKFAAVMKNAAGTTIFAEDEPILSGSAEGILTLLSTAPVGGSIDSLWQFSCEGSENTVTLSGTATQAAVGGGTITGQFRVEETCPRPAGTVGTADVVITPPTGDTYQQGTPVEYAVMLALIIVVCITAITTLGTNPARRALSGRTRAS